MPRVEVITRGDRRRVWTLEQKREIVAESLGPDLTPTEVARKHGISSGLLYGWRQKLLSGQMTHLRQSLPSFVRWSPEFGQRFKLGLLLRRTDLDDEQEEAVFGGFQGEGSG